MIGEVQQMKIYKVLATGEDRDIFFRANSRKNVVYYITREIMDLFGYDYIYAKSMIKSCRVYCGKVDEGLVTTIHWA